MKRIILVRHAKSSWEYNVSDFERPLKPRGFKDINVISKEFINKLSPDLILSSDALRAKTTAEIFVSNIYIDLNEIIFNHNLYDFSGTDLLNIIKQCGNSVNELMVFGHNNAITNFVNSFGDKIIDNVPTSGVVIIEFNISSWRELKKGKTIQTLFPKDLKNYRN
jgi:phosphohistidine phosphatase